MFRLTGWSNIGLRASQLLPAELLEGSQRCSPSRRYRSWREMVPVPTDSRCWTYQQRRTKNVREREGEGKRERVRGGRGRGGGERSACGCISRQFHEVSRFKHTSDVQCYKRCTMTYNCILQSVKHNVRLQFHLCLYIQLRILECMDHFPLCWSCSTALISQAVEHTVFVHGSQNKARNDNIPYASGVCICSIPMFWTRPRTKRK